MPYKKKKNKSGGYTVSSPSGTKAKNTTKKNADAQIRLLNAIEHGFEPTKGKKKKSKRTRASRSSY